MASVERLSTAAGGARLAAPIHEALVAWEAVFEVGVHVLEAHSTAVSHAVSRYADVESSVVPE